LFSALTSGLFELNDKLDPDVLGYQDKSFPGTHSLMQPEDIDFSFHYPQTASLLCVCTPE